MIILFFAIYALIGVVVTALFTHFIDPCGKNDPTRDKVLEVILWPMIVGQVAKAIWDTF